MTPTKFPLLLILYTFIGLLLCPHPSFSLPIQIFLVEDKTKFMGDYDQLKGLSRSLCNHLQEKNFEPLIIEYSIDQVDKAILELKETPYPKIGLFVGPYGIDAIFKLKKTLEDQFTAIHLSHQKLNRHFDLLKDEQHPWGADFIVLPSHVIDEEIKSQLNKSQTKLLETVGVCQNVLPIQIHGEYEHIKSQIPQSSHSQVKYLGVVLAGDTQNPDGLTWNFYQPEEAKMLAYYVAQRVHKEGYVLLITNGPRTGKFDPHTGQELFHVHKEGIIDPVTAAFENALIQEGLNHNHYVIFDFQHGKPSYWKALLGCLNAHPSSCLLIEGGSTSMISQALANLSPYTTDIIIYPHTAMTPTHHNHMKAEYASGRVGLLKEDMTLVPRQEHSTHSIRSTEDMLAEEIIKNLALNHKA